jgi:hypothetical protein
MLAAGDEGRINGPYLLLTEPAAASAVSTIHQEAR